MFQAVLGALESLPEERVRDLDVKDLPNALCGVGDSSGKLYNDRNSNSIAIGSRMWTPSRCRENAMHSDSVTGGRRSCGARQTHDAALSPPHL